MQSKVSEDSTEFRNNMNKRPLAVTSREIWFAALVSAFLSSRAPCSFGFKNHILFGQKVKMLSDDLIPDC